MKMKRWLKPLVVAGLLNTFRLTCCAVETCAADQNPYHASIERVLNKLNNADAQRRIAGLERIGLMRAFELVPQTIKQLDDADPAVRREATMTLGLIGNRSALNPLKKALNDSDWTVRQSAANALFNLTGIDAKVDALASEEVRKMQAAAFDTAFAAGFDQQLLAQFEAAAVKLPQLDNRAFNLATSRYAATSSSVDKFYAEGITGGWRDWKANPADKAPWAVLDLGQIQSFEYLLIKLGNKCSLKNACILLSDDGENYTELAAYENSADRMVFEEPLEARFIKVTCTGTNQRGVPMTLSEIEVWNKKPNWNKTPEFREEFYAAEKAARAMERLDVKAAVPLLVEAIRPYESIILKYDYDNETFWGPESLAVVNRSERFYVQAVIRALGRLGGPDAKAALVRLFERNNSWSSYAAQALGDCGDEQTALFLIDQFWKYGVWLERNGSRGSGNGDAIRFMDDSDRGKLAAYDRVPRTWHHLLASLCRLDCWTPEVTQALRKNCAYLVSSVPNIWDGTVSWQKEANQEMTGYLLERAGARREAMNAVYQALKIPGYKVSADFEHRDIFLKLMTQNLYGSEAFKGPYAGPVMISCADASDIPELVKLLDHETGWIRIDASRALLYLNAQEAIDPAIELLTKAPDDLDYGVDGDYTRLSSIYSRQIQMTIDKTKLKPGHGYDEINDPAPRFKEGWIRMLGGLKAERAVPILIDCLNNERNALEIMFAAANALAEISSPAALEALAKADVDHPVSTVRTVAREALWAKNVTPLPRAACPKTEELKQLPVPKGLPKEIVFIKGDLVPINAEQYSQDMSSYSTTDGGPTYRIGRNIYKIRTADPDGSLTALTHFKEGWVADLEVSYDGKRILFSRRGASGKDPFWHVYEMNADGSNLTQITSGPYIDVHPNYMPDGRLVFTTSRTAIRDEYHGYPANGLAVMNHDGSDIHVIGINMGRDAEPVIGEDGKILFTRLELFYSRNKTEWNLLSVFPDGTRAVTLYGPERREFHDNIKGALAMTKPRHRVLRMTQPQPWNGAEILMNTFKGPMIVAGPTRERLLRPKNDYAIATPIKIDDQTLLCSAGKRPPVNPKSAYKNEDKNYDIWAPVDHGLHYMDVNTGKLTLIYNDPETAEFEARALQPHTIPPVGLDLPMTRDDAFTGRMMCNSIYNTRQTYVKQRGKYIRVNEGIPTIVRHNTHNSGIAWRNHGGAVGRIWGTVPVAADGSFALSLPADRLFHFQVLDADFRVVGNEFIWQYTRPSENKSCVGCHEAPGATPDSMKFPLAHRQAPLQLLPQSDDVRYHAKMWFKGWGPDEREERMRVANGINIHGRY